MAEENDLNKADVNDIPDLNALKPGETIERSDESESTSTTETKPQIEESSTEVEASGASGQTDETPTTEGEEPIKPKDEGTEVVEGDAGESPKPEEKGAIEAPETTVDQRNTILSEMSGSRVESQEDLGAVLDHYQELLDYVKVVEEDPKSLLPEGKARAVFEHVMKQPGEDYNGSIQKFYHVLGLGDPKDLSPEEAQFEGFMLDPKNTDLTREAGKKLFDLNYEKRYGEGLDVIKAEDPLLYREHDVATNEARKQISDMQTEFKTETAKSNSGVQQAGFSEEERAEFDGQIDASLNDYAGLSITFDKDAKPEDGINFVLEDQSDIDNFSETLKDPGKWFDGLLAKHLDTNGVFDADSYRNDMLVRIFPEKLAEVMYDQGFSRGVIANETGLKNAADADASGGSTPAASPDKTFHEEWADSLG